MGPGEKTFDMDGNPWSPVAPVKPVSPEAPVAPVIPELPVKPVKPAKAEAVLRLSVSRASFHHCLSSVPLKKWCCLFVFKAHLARYCHLWRQ